VPFFPSGRSPGLCVGFSHFWPPSRACCTVAIGRMIRIYRCGGSVGFALRRTDLPVSPERVSQTGTKWISKGYGRGNVVSSASAPATSATLQRGAGAVLPKLRGLSRRHRGEAEATAQTPVLCCAATMHRRRAPCSDPGTKPPARCAFASGRPKTLPVRRYSAQPPAQQRRVFSRKNRWPSRAMASLRSVEKAERSAYTDVSIIASSLATLLAKLSDTASALLNKSSSTGSGCLFISTVIAAILASLSNSRSSSVFSRVSLS